jgi:hypothetical protein
MLVLKKEKGRRFRVNPSLCENYSSTGAPTGQTPAQEPQETH